MHRKNSNNAFASHHKHSLMEENSTVKTRLLDYLRSKRISQSEFTKSLGVSSTYIGAMRKSIPASKLKKISELYPDLSRDWLLYGEGEMLKAPLDAENDRLSENYETLLLPVEAYAGGLQMWSEGVRRSDCQRIVSPISGAEFAIPISGDSMEPRFHDGSTLLIKRINDRAFIPWGHTMVIDTENGVLVKNILPDDQPSEGDDERYIVAESINPKYPPFKIPMSSVYGLYRVLGSIEYFPNL